MFLAKGAKHSNTRDTWESYINTEAGARRCVNRRHFQLDDEKMQDDYSAVRHAEREREIFKQHYTMQRDRSHQDSQNAGMNERKIAQEGTSPSFGMQMKRFQQESQRKLETLRARFKKTNEALQKSKALLDSYRNTPAKASPVRAHAGLLASFPRHMTKGSGYLSQAAVRRLSTPAKSSVLSSSSVSSMAQTSTTRISQNPEARRKLLRVMEILIGVKLLKDATDARMRVGMDKLSIFTLSRRTQEYASRLDSQAKEIEGLNKSLDRTSSALESKNAEFAELVSTKDEMRESCSWHLCSREIHNAAIC